jgi:hypothetical protein
MKTTYSGTIKASVDICINDNPIQIFEFKVKVSGSGYYDSGSYDEPPHSETDVYFTLVGDQPSWMNDELKQMILDSAESEFNDDPSQFEREYDGNDD